MGMTFHVVGIVPNDEDWARMKAVHDACAAAGVDVPREVEKFFGGENPDASGAIVRFRAPGQSHHEAVKEWRGDGAYGYEVDISKLPPHVKVLRFFASY